jgi:hypothetical protein
VLGKNITGEVRPLAISSKIERDLGMSERHADEA